jgi:hypothetical protein
MIRFLVIYTDNLIGLKIHKNMSELCYQGYNLQTFFITPFKYKDMVL